MTKEQLAKATGIPRRHISEIENNKGAIGKQNARKLADVLHVDLKCFFLRKTEANMSSHVVENTPDYSKIRIPSLETRILRELKRKKNKLIMPLKPLPRFFTIPDNYKDLVEKANEVVIYHTEKDFYLATKGICLWYWQYYGGKKYGFKNISDKINDIKKHMDSLCYTLFDLDVVFSDVIDEICKEKEIEKTIHVSCNSNYCHDIRNTLIKLIDIFENVEQCIPESQKFPTLSGRERLVLNLATLYNMAKGPHPLKGALDFASENMTAGWDRITGEESKDGVIHGRFLEFVIDFFEAIDIQFLGKKDNKNNSLGKFIYQTFGKAKKILE